MPKASAARPDEAETQAYCLDTQVVVSHLLQGSGVEGEQSSPPQLLRQKAFEDIKDTEPCQSSPSAACKALPSNEPGCSMETAKAEPPCIGTSPASPKQPIFEPLSPEDKALGLRYMHVC